MRRQPMLRFCVPPGAPVFTQLEHQKVSCIPQLLRFSVSKRFLPYFRSHQGRADKYPYAFGVHPQRGGVFVDVLLDVFKDLLGKRGIVFSRGHQNKVVPLVGIRYIFSKRIFRHGRFSSDWIGGWRFQAYSTDSGCPNPWRPDPSDTRIPIGAPDTSVQNQGINTLTPLRVPHQHGKNACDMRIRGSVKHCIGQLHGMFKKSVMVHGVSIDIFGGWLHSYFPVGV